MRQVDSGAGRSAAQRSLRQLNPDSAADSNLWDAYVASVPGASSAHQMGWLRVIKRVFGHETYALAVEGADAALCGILPLVFLKSRLFGTFLVSMPFLNYGGVLADGSEEERLLLAEAAQLRERLGAAHVELRHAETVVEGLPCRTHKVSMLLPLCDSEDAQWAKLNAKVRNQVRKAQKSGLTATVGNQALLDGFYTVFARNMRDLGTPVYSKSFFARILEEFPASSRIIMVELDGKPVAAGLVMWQHGRLEVPWASSLREYNSSCPNNLLYWEAIRFAVGLGQAVLDFGRSTPGGGTYKFKAQWGAAPVQLHWQYMLKSGDSIPDITPTNPRYQAAIAVWKRLPVPVTNVIGPLLVRSIP